MVTDPVTNALSIMNTEVRRTVLKGAEIREQDEVAGSRDGEMSERSSASAGDPAKPGSRRTPVGRGNHRRVYLDFFRALRRYMLVEVGRSPRATPSANFPTLSQWTGQAEQ